MSFIHPISNCFSLSLRGAQPETAHHCEPRNGEATEAVRHCEE
jgi:hypothetical protein